MSSAICALELDSERTIVHGSESALCDAIRRGADLRVSTSFLHGAHIDPNSSNMEVVEETSEFRVTYLVDDRWTAGVMTMRQPIDLPNGFGARPSMSFFLYNQDGEQAIARPFLDGKPATGALGPGPIDDHSKMPKYHQHDNWDVNTNAPSQNFIYDFGVFGYWIRDDWQEVLAMTPEGTVISGSVEDLARASGTGGEIKVAIRGLCSDLADEEDPELDHEVFVQAGSYYYYTERKLFIAGTHPLARTRMSIPVRYKSRAWDFGWLMCRSDGLAVRRICDPYTLNFTDTEGRYAMRWFVR